MKKLDTKELEATLASLRQLRDRFASAEAWSAVRQIELTIDEAEAELASRRGGSAAIAEAHRRPRGLTPAGPGNGRARADRVNLTQVARWSLSDRRSR